MLTPEQGFFFVGWYLKEVVELSCCEHFFDFAEIVDAVEDQRRERIDLVEREGRESAPRRQSVRDIRDNFVTRSLEKVGFVHPVKFLDREYRTTFLHLIQAEFLDEHISREHFTLVARVPPEERKIVGERFG